MAESTVDEAIRADGRHIRVEEEPLIGLAFILPEDGYSCDIVRGIPTGLVDFLTPLSPLCRLTPNPSAAGYWTIYFQDPMRSPSAMSGRSFAAAFNNLTIGSGGSQPPHTPGSVISDRHSMMNNNNMTNLNMSMSNMSMNSMMGPSNNHLGGAGVLSPNGSVGGGSGVIGGPHLMTNGHIGGNPPMVNGNSSGMLSQKPDVHSIKLQKISNGLGLSIVAAKVRKVIQIVFCLILLAFILELKTGYCVENAHSSSTDFPMRLQYYTHHSSNSTFFHSGCSFVKSF